MTTTLTEKTFAELFTYSGGTNGTCVNSQGLVQPSVTPRFDFDPITKAPKGLLIENPRQNLLSFSSRFDRSPTWTRSNATPLAQAAIAPNGRWDACKLTLNSGAAAGSGHIAQTIAKPATATTYAYSFYAKAGGSSSGWIYARGASSADSISIPFNLTTMTATGVATGGFVEVSKRVVDAGNGWRRVELVFASDASAALVAAIYPGSSGGTSGSGDGVAGIYIWGAQLEAGAFASSHIPSIDTFTGRASIGSYYDAKGILRYAAVGAVRNSYEPSNLTLPPVLMVEEQRTNILQKSSDMHLTPWATSGVSRASGKLAPDGSLRAVEVSGAPTGPFAQTGPAATSTVMTYSVYVRNVSRTAPISLLLRNSTTSTNFTFGVCTLSGADPSISGAGWEMRPVGNGWFRCSYTQATGIGVGDAMACYAGFTDGGPDGGAFQIWGAQLEAGPYATSYIPSAETFTGRASIGTYFDSTGAMKTAASGAARMSYNPANLDIAPWLMLEGQATNLFTESECRNGLSDIPSRTGVTATAVDWLGFTTGIAYPTLAAGQPYYYAVKTPALAASTAYTISVFVKMDDGLPLSLGAGAGSDFALVIANAPIPTANTSISPMGNGVYRVTGWATTGTTPSSICGAHKYAANSPRPFKITGFQLEQGTFATSYIPTTTAVVTRLADAASSAATTRQADTATSAATTRALDNVRIDTTKGWFNTAEGTVFMELEAPRTSDTGTKTVLEFGGAGGRMGVSYSAANITNAVAYGYTVIDGTTLATPPKVLPGPIAKIAMSYGADGVRFAYNNQPIQKVVTPIAGLGTTYLGLGSTYSGGNCPFFRIRAVRYQPQKLTDAEVVALTA